MKKSCLTCEHGSLWNPSNPGPAFCDLDIGEYIAEPEHVAPTCRFYQQISQTPSVPFKKFRKSCLTCANGDITDSEKGYVDCPFSIEVIKNPDEDASECNLYSPLP